MKSIRDIAIERTYKMVNGFGDFENNLTEKEIETFKGRWNSQLRVDIKELQWQATMLNRIRQLERKLETFKSISL